MAANQKDFSNYWGDEPTVSLKPYRVLHMGCNDDGILIHVTPAGHHVVDLDCDGVCLTCGQPLEGTANATVTN